MVGEVDGHLGRLFRRDCPAPRFELVERDAGVDVRLDRAGRPTSSINCRNDDPAGRLRVASTDGLLVGRSVDCGS